MSLQFMIELQQIQNIRIRVIAEDENHALLLAKQGEGEVEQTGAIELVVKEIQHIDE